MSELMGYRVTAHNGRETVSDNFEVRSAAIECAQVLERMKLREISAYVVMREVDGVEELIPMEWMCHVVGKPEGVAA